MDAHPALRLAAPPDARPAPAGDGRGRDIAAQYNRCTARYLLGPWATDVVEAAALAPGDRVLDVACGTGLIAREARRRVGLAGQVSGLDRDETMLSVARTRGPEGRAIRWHLGDATALPFEDASFDALTCQQGLQFFSDRTAALREFRRVLRPGGTLAVAVWGRIEHNPYHFALSHALAEFVGREAGLGMREPFSLSEPDELVELMLATGWADVAVSARTRKADLPPMNRFVPEHLAGTSHASAFAALPLDLRTALCRCVARGLIACIEGSRYAPALCVNIGTARRP